MNSSFKRFCFYTGILTALAGCMTKHNTTETPSFDWVESEQPIDLSWAQEVGAKSFPNQRVVNANAFGAINDATILST